MKILERLALILFSIIMMVLAITSCLVIFNVLQLEVIYKFLDGLIQDETAKKVIVGVSAVSIILAIKALFFPTKTKKKQEIKTGVLLENKDGRLLISRDTIENLVNSVVRSFDEAMDVQTKVNLDGSSNITVYVSLLVREDSIIKELSSNIQNKIKQTINRNTGLEVSQVNINIKDIENDKKGNTQARLKAADVKVSSSQTKDNNEISLGEVGPNNDKNQSQNSQEYRVAEANETTKVSD